MTHDFHYYVTYMCARNAGYDIPTSIKMAICADGVDGGDMPFIKNSKGKYKSVSKDGNNYYPLTVYHAKSSVNSTHSLGVSIITVPWMAFHFLPSLEIDDRSNPYHLKRSEFGATTDEARKALDLESGLICSKKSRFADALIKYTAGVAKKIRGGSNKDGVSIDDKYAAKLGIRAHIIADLFAHEGFAGCRSRNINALNHANTLNKLSYDPDLAFPVSFLKVTRIAQLGHGQAGQRPDEPFIEYTFQRKIDGQKFKKTNMDLFGQALMTLTQVLKGDILKGDKPADYEEWYSKWKRTEKSYKYQWAEISKGMNAPRKDRVEFLRQTIMTKEGWTKESMKVLTPFMTVSHDRTDYWSFEMLNSKNTYPNIAQHFSNEADKHLKWFHKTFSKLAGVGIDQYLDASILWLSNSKDDKTGRRHTLNLVAGGEVHVGSTGNVSGNQIGTQYMDMRFPPSTLHQNLMRS